MLRTTFLNSQQLPLVIEAEKKKKSAHALADLALSNKAQIQENLLQHGAILFRGFDVASVAEFENFVSEYSGKPFFNYAGGVSPRNALSDGVYTSTEYPSDLPLSLHNELSYSDIFPEHLYFFCLTAPQFGGETTLGDSRRIIKHISPKTVGLFKYKRVCYERNLSGDKGSGYSWQDAFETDSKEQVKQRCNDLRADFKWNPDNSLCLSQIGPATKNHPKTGEEVWFNQAEGFHHSILPENSWQQETPRLDSSFGDGSPICLTTLTSIRDVMQKETIKHKWQKGDILLIDNILTAHGRMPFTGLRKIALAMT